MNDAYIMYHYCGPPLRDSAELVPERDSRSAREKMNEASSTRAWDLSGNLDFLKTYELIFERPKELLRKEGWEYVLDISDPENPQLEFIEENRDLPPHYRTQRQILDEKSVKRKAMVVPQKARRKGWTNNFFYRKRGN